MPVVLICNRYSIQCEKCGERFIPNAPNKKLCDKCGAYIPQETKTIICVDCGKEVVVDSKDNETCRCEECYKIYRRKYKAEKEKERRMRLKSKNVDSAI